MGASESRSSASNQSSSSEPPRKSPPRSAPSAPTRTTSCPRSEKLPHPDVPEPSVKTSSSTESQPPDMGIPHFLLGHLEMMHHIHMCRSSERMFRLSPSDTRLFTVRVQYEHNITMRRTPRRHSHLEMMHHIHMCRMLSEIDHLHLFDSDDDDDDDDDDDRHGISPMVLERHTVKRTLLDEDKLKDLSPSQRHEVEREVIKQEAQRATRPTTSHPGEMEMMHHIHSSPRSFPSSSSSSPPSFSDTRLFTVRVQYEHNITMRRTPRRHIDCLSTSRTVLNEEEIFKDLPSSLRDEINLEMSSMEVRFSHRLLEDTSSLSPRQLTEASMSHMHHESPRKLRSSLEFLPPNMSELRVILLGNSCSERSSVIDFTTSASDEQWGFHFNGYQSIRARVEDDVVLIKPPDLLLPNISEDELREHVGTCVRLSAPGPHLFLLVLQPEDFTEEHRQRLCRVLELFSYRSFDHSLVLISTPREEKPGFMEEYRQHPPIKDMIRMCKYRFLWRKDLELEELLTRFGQIVKENNGEHLK